jgi:hypothetical protein
MTPSTICLVIGGAIGCLVGIIHGCLLRSHLTAPLLAHARAIPQLSGTTKRLIVPLVQFSTYAWISGGLALIAAALWLSPQARLIAALIVGSQFFYGAVFNLAATRRAHPGWILMSVALIAIAIGLLSDRESDDPHYVCAQKKRPKLGEGMVLRTKPGNVGFLQPGSCQIQIVMMIVLDSPTPRVQLAYMNSHPPLCREMPKKHSLHSLTDQSASLRFCHRRQLPRRPSSLVAIPMPEVIASRLIALASLSGTAPKARGTKDEARTGTDPI